ncbi:MAG: phage terminase large subunit [Clostridia bacterium]
MKSNTFKKKIILKIEKPNKKQEEFFNSKERFVAYGGARGGGKSWAVRKKAMLLAINFNGIKIMILRRTYGELRENHINPLKKELKDIANYKDSEKTFFFPNESVIIFGYCDDENDVLRYQGQEYDVIFIDEATQLTSFQYNSLCACLRGANDFPKRIYLTCNPGGVGHGWVKRLFIDKNYKKGELESDYKFIFASVYDNYALLKKDKGYINMLYNLPEKLKKAWLDGNWDVLSGQYFTEWDRSVHVIKPFKIKEHWRRYFSMDYGLDMLAGYFIAIDEKGNCFVYKEIYEKNLIISKAAKLIKNFCQTEKIDCFFAPPDLWNRRQDSGKSVAEIFCENGIYLQKVSNDRISGWLNLKEWLSIYDEFGKRTTRFKVFESCENLIKSIPMLLYDKHNPNDCATEPHKFTHGPDAIRYFFSGRPLPCEKQAYKKHYLPKELRENNVNEKLFW